MSAESECIFCRIVAGTAPSATIYQDDLVVAIMDVNPAADGHCLVVSREHAPTIFDLSEDAALASMRAALRVAGAIREALRPDGLNLIQANGRAAFQTVDHFHLHVVPRWAGDAIRLPWIPTPGDPARIAEAAAKIRDCLR